MFERKYKKTKEIKIRAIEAGAPYCVPTEIYTRIMKDTPTHHYLRTAAKFPVLKQQVEAEAKNKEERNLINQSTTPIGAGLEMDLDEIPKEPTPHQAKRIFKNLTDSLENLGIDWRNETHGSIKQKLEALQKELDEPIDLSGVTPPQQDDPMDVDNDKDNNDNKERSRENNEKFFKSRKSRR